MSKRNTNWWILVPVAWATWLGGYLWLGWRGLVLAGVAWFMGAISTAINAVLKYGDWK